MPGADGRPSRFDPRTLRHRIVAERRGMPGSSREGGPPEVHGGVRAVGRPSSGLVQVGAEYLRALPDDEVGRQQDVGVPGQPHDDVRRGPRPHAPQGEQVGPQRGRVPTRRQVQRAVRDRRRGRQHRLHPGAGPGQHTAPAFGHGRGGRHQPPAVHPLDRLAQRRNQAGQVRASGGEGDLLTHHGPQQQLPSVQGAGHPDPGCRRDGRRQRRVRRQVCRHRRPVRIEVEQRPDAAQQRGPRSAARGPDDHLAGAGREVERHDVGTLRRPHGSRIPTGVPAFATRHRVRGQVPRHPGQVVGRGERQADPAHVRPACRSARGSTRARHPAGR